MTDKKHAKHIEEQAQANAGAEQEEQALAEAQPTPSDPAEVLRIKLSEAEAKSAENLDGWQRALAEFQNYKKRVDRDRTSEQAAMKGDLIRKVLPVLDDLDRALQNRPEDDAWANGIELIQRKLRALLEAEGIQQIDAEGAIFDPNFHEAISQEPVDGVESGRVVAVMLPGYMLGDRVIRPAQVRVAA